MNQENYENDLRTGPGAGEDGYDPCQKRFQRLFEDLARMLPALVFEVDAEGRMTFADEPAFRMASFESERRFIPGRTSVFRLIVPEDRQRMKDNLQRIFHANESEALGLLSGDKYRYRNLDGVIRTFRVYGTPVRSGGRVVAVKGVAVDETERIEAEVELMESRRRLSTLMDNLQGMVYRCLNDADWTMLFVSNGALELTGYEASDLQLGKTVQYGDLIHPEDVNLVWSTVQKGVESNTPFKMVYRLNHRTQGYRWVWEQGRSVGPDPDGNIILEGFISDITDKQKALEELQVAKEKAEESDRLKSAFLANMSHEIRTPLNAIIGFSNLLLEPDYDTSQQAEYASIIERAGKQLLSLVNDIIDVSLIETGQVKLFPKDISLSRLLEEIYKLYQKKNTFRPGVKFRLDLPDCDRDLQYRIDDFRLRQVIQNLVDNALKFTWEGEVVLGCRGIDTDSPEVVVFVKDTGIGMPEDKLPFIFERFFQIDQSKGRQQGGTGLGLAITRGYVELMGGRIEVDSILGKGTEFRLNFPLSHPMRAVNGSFTHTEPEQDNLHLVGRTVLVVEDEDHSMLFLENALSSAGLQVIKARDGKQAVACCEDMQPVDIVLMDLKLPDMSGLEACRQLLRLRPGLKVIAQTAYAMAGDEKAAFEAGCIGYLTKPYTRGALLSALSSHL